MCIPIAGVGGGLSLVSSAAGFAQESAAASAQNSHARELSQRNSDLARSSARNQFGAITDRVFQEAARQGLAAEQVVADSLRAQSRVQAAAAEAGAEGASVNALLRDFARQEAQAIFRGELSESFVRDQARIDLESVNIGLESRLLAATPDEVPQPNLFASAINAFSGAFSTALTLDAAANAAGEETLLL